VLASTSPPRRRALDLLGLKYHTAPPGVDEKAIRDPDPEVLTRLLSEAKARAVGDVWPGPCVVVAGDAVVGHGSRILEKPQTLDEAFEMLSAMSGSTFAFVTGVAVYHTGSGRLLSTVGRSEISFRRLEEREIRDYIEAYPVLRFAGAFEEDAVIRFAERVAGSPNFRTAIPVGELTLLLREQGVAV
jgi:septum formation protein